MTTKTIHVVELRVFDSLIAFHLGTNGIATFSTVWPDGEQYRIFPSCVGWSVLTTQQKNPRHASLDLVPIGHSLGGVKNSARNGTAQSTIERS
jgi:hypothetical protein